MKLLMAVALVAVNLIIGAGPQTAADAKAEEQLVRELDRQQADAVQRRDVTALEKLWADDLVVNAPHNQVLVGRKAVEERMRGGIIHYASFERQIEHVARRGNVMFVMGAETIKPTGNAPQAGQTVQRRYTNVWMKEDGRWLLVARHANVIAPAK